MPEPNPPEGPAPEGYRLLRTLGYGGDGWVTLAVQESVVREVAVKTLYATDASAVARFRREGHALSRVASDRIVRVYDLLDDGERFSLVLEYVPGGSLAERLLRPPPLTAKERLAVLSDIAEALGCAHRAGIVHRDVKPANVLLDAQGRAKLTDFGISRLTAGAAAFRTQDRSISATVRYAPPEQRADPLADAPSIDAYAFGVLASELLVGAGGDTAALPTKAVTALQAATAVDPAERPDPESLVKVLAAVPPELWRPPTVLTVTDQLTDHGTSRSPTEGEGATMTIDPVPSTRSSNAELDWVEPTVYRPPTRGLDRRFAWIAGAAVGVLAAVLATLLLS